MEKLCVNAKSVLESVNHLFCCDQMLTLVPQGAFETVDSYVIAGEDILRACV